VSAYASTEEHVADALKWIDDLVRAHVCRRQAEIAFEGHRGPDQPEQVGDGELGSFLETGKGHPPGDSAWLAAADSWLAAAEDRRQQLLSRQTASTAEASRLLHLSKQLGLAPEELDVITLCLWGESNSRNRRLLGFLAGDPSRKVPDIAIVRALLGTATDEFLAPQRPLVAQHIVRLVPDEPAIEAFSTMNVVLDPRIGAHVAGIDYFEEQLADRVSTLGPLSDDDLMLPAKLRDKIVEDAARSLVTREGLRVTLRGAPGSGRTAVARLCAGLGSFPLLCADVSTPIESVKDFVAAVYREARLRGAAVFWRGCSAVASHDALFDQSWNALVGMAAHHSQPSFFDHAQPWDASTDQSGSRWTTIELPTLTTDERGELWQLVLGQRHDIEEGIHAQDLAESFRLTPGRMRDAISAAQALADQRGDGELIAANDLAEACRRQSQRRILSLARRVDTPRGLTLDDLVLPDDHKRQINLLRARIMYRERVDELRGEDRSGPRGLVAMFSGSSGTGKTFAAGLLADDLGRDLLKVDLSQVVSKWVGETEKHLDRLFNEAHDAHAILFFDEADALFGKRGEVTNAQDRYAAQEVGFLLQRIEEFDGVVILATNLRQNLDPAFLRRIQVVVEFPLPDEAARNTIWKRQLAAAGVILTDDEVSALARPHRLSAAAIAQVVCSATYLAGPELRFSCTVENVENALAIELLRLGLPGVATGHS
jgi:AAA+ superfamily predicted ATPase